MGDLFASPGLQSNSTVSGAQGGLLQKLADYAGTQLGQSVPGYDQLLSSLLGSTSQQSTDLAKSVWKQGFLDPVLNSFDTSIAPRINSQFAGIGGTLSSRRTKDLADTLGNLTTQASGQFAQMLPTIMNFPLQQTLGQIQGLGGLQQAQWTPFNNISRFATSPTVQTQQTPAGPGWGLLGSGISALGFGLGGGFGGGGSTVNTSGFRVV